MSLSVSITQFTGGADDLPPFAFPYDIYDGRAKVLVYKINADRWQGAQTFQPEWMTHLNTEMYSVQTGVLYRHNASSEYNKFYGVTYPSRLMFVANADAPSVQKVYQSLSVESALKPDFTHLRTENPYVQSSDLLPSDYDTREGVNYAGILRDRLSPNVTGTVLEKQVSGDKMRGSYLMVMLEYAATTLNRIRFVNILFNRSKGHLN